MQMKHKSESRVCSFEYKLGSGAEWFCKSIIVLQVPLENVRPGDGWRSFLTNIDLIAAVRLASQVLISAGCIIASVFLVLLVFLTNERH